MVFKYGAFPGPVETGKPEIVPVDARMRAGSIKTAKMMEDIVMDCDLVIPVRFWGNYVEESWYLKNNERTNNKTKELEKPA